MFTKNQLYNYNSSDYNNKEKKTNTLHSERRLWDKEKTMLNFEYPDQEKILMNKKRYEEYLFKLHVNNQIMKMASRKDEKDEKIEKLEDGFSIYVNGAHKKNEKYTPRYTVTKSSDSSKKIVNFNPNVHTVKQSNYNELKFNKYESSSKSNFFEKKERKKWGNSSFIIKTMEGYEIKINTPNSNMEPISKSEPANSPNENLNYSEDFESDSECENEHQSLNSQRVSKRNKNLIQSVKFSDSSESDDDISKNEKNIVYDLSPKEIKTLRESLCIFDNSDKNESESEIDTDSEFEDGKLKENEGKSQFIASFRKEGENFESIVDDELEDESKNSSDMCKMILNQVANLKLEDRKNLVKFLSNFDCNSRKNKKKRSK